MSQYELVIGLEVHAELLTESKIFSTSAAHFGGDPNSHVSPICLGLPGALPVLNRAVVDLAIKAALATNCAIAPECKFDRKNYFYPDLPKGYQISQYDQPIGANGWLDVEVGDAKKRVGITRIHMEEDAGKLVHAGADRLAGSSYSLVDLNRAGVPLIEVVSEPDMRSADEARAYLEMLRNIFIYIGVCDGRMEEGSLRCDVNISLRPFGSDRLGTKVEIKNINSFRSLMRAVEYETARQTSLLDDGEAHLIVQETRLWDENKGVTNSMRGKEDAHDYRYFPEPDLVPLVISPAWIDSIRQSLPELPAARRDRYISELGLTPYDAGVLIAAPELAFFFDQTVAVCNQPKIVANWLIGDVSAMLNQLRLNLAESRLTPALLAELIQLVTRGDVSQKNGKEILSKVMETGESPKGLLQALGLGQLSDESEIQGIVSDIISANPAQVAEFYAGKEKVITFLVGQIMRASKGRAKPDVVNRLLMEQLEAKRPVNTH